MSIKPVLALISCFYLLAQPSFATLTCFEVFTDPNSGPLAYEPLVQHILPELIQAKIQGLEDLQSALTSNKTLSEKLLEKGLIDQTQAEKLNRRDIFDDIASERLFTGFLVIELVHQGKSIEQSLKLIRNFQHFDPKSQLKLILSVVERMRLNLNDNVNQHSFEQFEELSKKLSLPDRQSLSQFISIWSMLKDVDPKVLVTFVYDEIARINLDLHLDVKEGTRKYKKYVAQLQSLVNYYPRYYRTASLKNLNYEALILEDYPDNRDSNLQLRTAPQKILAQFNDVLYKYRNQGKQRDTKINIVESIMSSPISDYGLSRLIFDNIPFFYLKQLVDIRSSNRFTSLEVPLQSLIVDRIELYNQIKNTHELESNYNSSGGFAMKDITDTEFRIIYKRISAISNMNKDYVDTMSMELNRAGKLLTEYRYSALFNAVVDVASSKRANAGHAKYFIYYYFLVIKQNKYFDEKNIDDLLDKAAESVNKGEFNSINSMVLELFDKELYFAKSEIVPQEGTVLQGTFNELIEKVKQQDLETYNHLINGR